MMKYKEWVEKKITTDNGIYGYDETFLGTRVTVNQVACLAKQGVTYSYLFGEFPFLTTLDVQYAVKYYNNNHEHKLLQTVS